MKRSVGRVYFFHQRSHVDPRMFIYPEQCGCRVLVSDVIGHHSSRPLQSSRSLKYSRDSH